MKNSNIISLEERKIQKAIEKSKYEGSITITASGKNLREAKFFLDLEYIEDAEKEYFLKYTLNALVKNNGWTKLSIAQEAILNKPLTILYYLPYQASDEFYFGLVNEYEMTEEQIGMLLYLCIKAIEND